jgi:tetratricopeptide (TPR) repeat protein
MKSLSCGMAAVGLALAAGSFAAAQAPAGGGQPEEPMTNIQVFPKGSTRAQVLQTMNAFNESLGVKCDYCHVLEGPGKRNDFASDEKRTKRVARQMFLFRDQINAMLPIVVQKDSASVTRVLCRSCHVGLPIPKQTTEILGDAEKGGGGAAAALAKFKELRAQFYGTQSYDFTDSPLLTMAQRATAASRPADAMTYLQANLEYHPKSARTYVAIAQAKNAKGDKAGAIRDLEKAVELDPGNNQAKSELQKIK